MLVARITFAIVVLVSLSRIGHVTTVVISIFHTVIVAVAIIGIATAAAGVLSASATHVFAVLADAVDPIDESRVIAGAAVDVIAVAVLGPDRVVARATVELVTMAPTVYIVAPASAARHVGTTGGVECVS